MDIHVTKLQIREAFHNNILTPTLRWPIIRCYIGLPLATTWKVIGVCEIPSVALSGNESLWTMSSG